MLFVACGEKKVEQQVEPKENAEAKKLLQGIWLNDDAGDVVFKVKGDTVYYPDTTSLPVYFKIVGDTFVLYGASVVKYPIQKQSHHLFVFANQNGEQVRLVKSEDPSDDYSFEGKKAQPLNQNRLIKRDTVITHGTERIRLSGLRITTRVLLLIMCTMTILSISMSSTGQGSSSLVTSASSSLLIMFLNSFLIRLY